MCNENCIWLNNVVLPICILLPATPSHKIIQKSRTHGRILAAFRRHTLPLSMSMRARMTAALSPFLAAVHLE